MITREIPPDQVNLLFEDKQDQHKEKERVEQLTESEVEPALRIVQRDGYKEEVEDL